MNNEKINKMIDNVYIDALSHVYFLGENRDSERTGNGTISSFDVDPLVYDMSNGFPILNTKKIHWKSVVGELIWFLSGSTDVYDLAKHGIKIWHKDAIRHNKTMLLQAKEYFDALKLIDGDNQFEGIISAYESLYMILINNESDMYDRAVEPYHYILINKNTLPFEKNISHIGELGRVYGASWRSFEFDIDQIKDLINSIINNPQGRRHVITTWNPCVLNNCALPPCHGLTTQFYVSHGTLHLKTYQRSCDMFLGLPFNLSSYGLLLSIVAKICNLRCGKLTTILGDAHIYNGHMDAVKTQLNRVPKINDVPVTVDLPDYINGVECLNIDFIKTNWKIEDFKLNNYVDQGSIKAIMYT